MVASSAALIGIVGVIPAAASTTQVSGVVTAADGSGTLAGMEVCASRPGSTVPCVLTGTDGTYSFALSPGSYTFRARDPYRYGQWVEQQFQDGAAIAIGTTARHIDFSLVRGARITGYLRTPAGGIPGNNALQVTAYPVNASGVTSKTLLTFSNTNSSGYFDVARLPAGTYKLFVDDGNYGNEPYARQWYPAASAASAGTAITVSTGQIAANRNMTLSPPSTLTIKLLHDGKPTPGQIEVYDADTRLVGYGTQVTPDVATLTGLRAGAYKVRALAGNAYPFAKWYTYKRAKTISIGAGQAAVRSFNLNYPTITALTPPKLTRYGQTLDASHPVWNVKVDPAYDLEWWRSDGVRVYPPLRLYRFTKSDIGKRIRYCEIAYRSGYARGYSCSAWSAVVTKADSG